MKIGLILGITLVAMNPTFAAECALPSADEIATAFDVEMTNGMHSVREFERSVSLLMKRINKYGQSSRSEWEVERGAVTNLFLKCCEISFPTNDTRAYMGFCEYMKSGVFQSFVPFSKKSEEFCDLALNQLSLFSYLEIPKKPEELANAELAGLIGGGGRCFAFYRNPQTGQIDPELNAISDRYCSHVRQVIELNRARGHYRRGLITLAKPGIERNAVRLSSAEWCAFTNSVITATGLTCKEQEQLGLFLFTHDLDFCVDGYGEYESESFDYYSLTRSSVNLRVFGRDAMLVPLPDQSKIDELFAYANQSPQNAERVAKILEAIIHSVSCHSDIYSEKEVDAVALRCLANTITNEQVSCKTSTNVWNNTLNYVSAKVKIELLKTVMNFPRIKENDIAINLIADFIGTIPRIGDERFAATNVSKRDNDKTLGNNRLENGRTPGVLSGCCKSGIVLEKQFWDRCRERCVDELLCNCIEIARQRLSPAEYEDFRINIIHRAHLTSSEIKRLFGE